jgi:hypothetical protein
MICKICLALSYFSVSMNLLSNWWLIHLSARLVKSLYPTGRTASTLAPHTSLYITQLVMFNYKISKLHQIIMQEHYLIDIKWSKVLRSFMKHISTHQGMDIIFQKEHGIFKNYMYVLLIKIAHPSESQLHNRACRVYFESNIEKAMKYQLHI